ncbi:MAG: T9SS type A sorting domain-containing protein, partial [Bacteroidales bacterium]|nr:T9SS type A sorting domain-containing protein [Bacteroidales bacterium]
EIVFGNFISFNDYVIGKLGKSLIKGMFGEDRISENLQGQYLIRDTMGNVLDFGPFGSFTNYILDSPVCSFEVNHEYLIIGETGQGTMHTRIDFMKDDKNPPALTSIKTIDAGRLPRQEFRTGNPASLMISAKDSPYPGNIKGILMDSTYAMISVHQQNNWERLDLFKTGSDREAGIILESDISAYTDQKASYDLKILIRDSSLNKTEYLLKPAFSVSDFLSGNFSRKPSMNDFSLRAYPNPFSRILHLEFEKTPEKAKINIYTLNGKPIMQKRIFDKASTLDLQNLKSGPYLLKVFNEHFQFLKRIIKE